MVISNDDSKLDEDWILDMACIFHVCPNRDWFEIYEIVTRGSIEMGNNLPYKTTCIGNVRVKMFDGMVKTLGNVKHILIQIVTCILLEIEF